MARNPRACGAESLPSRWSAARDVRRRRTTTRSRRSSQNAGQLVQGQRGAGGRPAGRHDHGHRAGRQRPDAVVRWRSSDAVAPLHEGTTATIRATSLSGIANRYVSLKPGPEQRASEIEDGGQIGADEHHRAGGPRPALQHARPEDARGPAELIQGRATQYDGTGAEASESIKYFAPVLVDHLAADAASWRSTRRCSSASSWTAPTRSSAIAERRDDLTDLVSNTNTAMRRDRRRERGAPARARAAAGHAAQGEHDLREPARDARRPGPAGGRVEAGNTKDLAPFFRALRPLVQDARPDDRATCAS